MGQAKTWQPLLEAMHTLGLVSEREIAETLAILDPAFPFVAAVGFADSVHLHVKVDDVDALPHAKIVAPGSEPENARPGYVKYSFAGGLNFIFSSIAVAEEDQLPGPHEAKPFVDHFGVDLRSKSDIVRSTFENVPTLALRLGWPTKRQGGSGRQVFCCHSSVEEKHWVYPPFEGARWTRPIEFAFGPLHIGEEMNGCDLRPIDPRHPAAGSIACCAPAAAVVKLDRIAKSPHGTAPVATPAGPCRGT